MVLPACPSLEKEGTFTNTERRIQRLYQVFEPLGDSQARLGNHSGHRQPSRRQLELQASLRDHGRGRVAHPTLRRRHYERLEGYKSLAMARRQGRHRSAAALTPKDFPSPTAKPSFYPLEWQSPCEEADTEFDLHLNNGRLLEHFEQGNHDLPHPKAFARSHPTLSLKSRPNWPPNAASRPAAGSVELAATGQVRVQVLVTDRVHGKQLYMPMNSVEEPVNRLTSSNTDRATHTPALQRDRREDDGAA